MPETFTADDFTGTHTFTAEDFSPHQFTAADFEEKPQDNLVQSPLTATSLLGDISSNQPERIARAQQQISDQVLGMTKTGLQSGAMMAEKEAQNTQSLNIQPVFNEPTAPRATGTSAKFIAAGDFAKQEYRRATADLGPMEKQAVDSLHAVHERFGLPPPTLDEVKTFVESDPVNESFIGISPENVDFGKGPIAGWVTAAAKGVNSVGQFMTSPNGMAQQLAAMTPAKAVIVGLWFKDMAQGAGQGAGNLSVLLEKPNKTADDIQEIKNETFNTALMLGGALGIGGHAASSKAVPHPLTGPFREIADAFNAKTPRPLVEPVVKDLQELAPATALEVAKTTEVPNVIQEVKPDETVQPEVKPTQPGVVEPPANEPTGEAPLSIGGGADEVRNQGGTQELKLPALRPGDRAIKIQQPDGTVIDAVTNGKEWEVGDEKIPNVGRAVEINPGEQLWSDGPLRKGETILAGETEPKEVAPPPAQEPSGQTPVVEQKAPVAPTPKTMVGRAKEFKRLVDEHGIDEGWIEDPENYFDPMANEKTGLGAQGFSIQRKKGELQKIAYERVAKALGEDRSSTDSQQGRAALLEKLQAYIQKQADEKAAMDAMERGDTGEEGSTDFTGMGGAVPSEFNKPGDYVSNMFAAIDRDRKAMGKEPMGPGARRTWDEDNQKALAKMNRDPGWIQGLLREVAANPRPLLSWENAGLVWYRAKLTAEAHNAMERVNRSFEDGRLEDRDAAQADMVRFENDIMQLDAAVGRGGTGSEAGRSLQAQKMATGEDFTLVEMRLQKRAAANDGAPLTPAQETEVAQLHQKIAETTAAYEKLLEERNALASEKALADSLQKIQEDVRKSPTYDPRVIKSAQEFVSELDKEAGDVMADFRKRYGASEIQSMGAAIFGEFDKPPRLVDRDLNDIAVYGASQIAKGLGDRAAWDKHMLEGSKWIQPYLDAIWLRSNKLLEARLAKKFGRKASKVAETIKKEPTRKEKATIEDKLREKFEKADAQGAEADVTGLVQKLARQFVEEGIRDRDELIAAVHEVISEIKPDWTERDTMDAISGYGKFKQLTKDEISVKLRDLKGQMQQVAKLEDMQASRPPSKTGIERRNPSDEERRLIRLVNQWKNEFQIPSTDPSTQLQSSLDTLKARLKHQISDFETKLANKDYSQRPGRRNIQMDRESNQLHYEMTKAKEAWHRAMMQDRLAKASKFMKTLRFGGEVLNTQRAILTSADFSAVLRQGGFIALGHPVRAAKSFPAMFRAFKSEAGQHAVMEEIKKRDNYPQYLRSKLYLSEHHQKLSQMEEAYMSRWADKIPLVAGSQRAYTTFLNKLRADSFDAMEKTLSRKGEFTPKEAEAVANYINVATGRGKFGVKNDAALAGMATMFFAPRYVASRFQLLAGQPLYGGTARTRVMVAKEYARFLAGIAVVYGLAKLDGASIEEDPRSSDFGKLRWGNTRLDPMAGLLQSTVLLSREASGETKQLKTGNIIPLRGPGVKFGGATGFDVLANFTRTKLAPAPGSAVNVLTGKDVVGNPVTLAGELQKMTVPLSLQDILKAMDEQGIPRGTAISLLSMFGMGLQNFDVNQKR